MKSWARWILVTVILAAVVHFLTVMGLPYMIMFALKLKTDREPNIIYHAPPMTAESRDVVRPSPDMLYSACPYDVSEKPLHITAPVPDTYFSISAFADNTNNFFVVNDRQVESDRMEIYLVKEGTKLAARGDAMVVEAPSVMGLVLFRMLIKDQNKIDELIKIQKQATCNSVNF